MTHMNGFIKGKYIYKDGQVYDGYFEDDKMTDSPTYLRTSKISEQLAKVKTRMPSGIAEKSISNHAKQN